MRNIQEFLLEMSRSTSRHAAERLFHEIPWRDFPRETGGPDLWFNAATQLSLVDLDVESLELSNHALTLFPDNIDLLGSAFQLQFGVMQDEGGAATTWARMQKSPDRMYNWRYWVYGAVYMAKTLHKPEDALVHLREGLHHVPSTDVANLYRTLPDIVGYFPAGSQYEDELEKVVADMRAGLGRISSESYTVAIRLAGVLQGQTMLEDKESKLNEAMNAIEVAEAKLDRTSSNHPLSGLLLAKARILIAQNRHTEALPLLRSIESGSQMRVESDKVKALRLLCEHILGEHHAPVTQDTNTVPGSQQLDPSTVALAFSELLKQNGASLLVALAQHDISARAAIVDAASALSNENDTN